MSTPPTILEHADVQGLVLRGYAHLPEACYYLLRIDDAAAFKAWLSAMLDAGRITTAQARPSAETGAFNIAFTPSGLRKLNVDPDPRAQGREGFSLEFREGMAHPDRSRLLGDVEHNDPVSWQWGSGEAAREERAPGVTDVDVICLLFAASRDDGNGSLRALWNACAPPRAAVDVRFVMPAWLSPDGKEPFGFRDGLSQPILRYTAREYAAVGVERELHVVEPGEFLLGYENQHGRMPISPSVSPERDRSGRLRPLENRPRLDPRSFGSDLRDFGRNGTYMVVRQLRQDVAMFRRFLEEQTKSSPEGGHYECGATSDHAVSAVAGGHANGGSHHEEAMRLAARLIGRWPDGAPLVRAPLHAPAHPGDNAFTYFADDRYGYRCPPGAHIRRANPRDALAHDDGGTARAIERVNTHRILRRGRRYGPRPAVESLDRHVPGIPHDEEGIVFICFNANLRTQFEFVQQTWVNNEKFAGLSSERDPLNGCPAERTRFDRPKGDTSASSCRGS
ncbi:MAG: hypothetical protein QM736_05290 [Vicinamibacterales bacterium]